MGRAASRHREAQEDSRVQEAHRASHHREAQVDRTDQEIHRASHRREAQVSKMDQEILPQIMQTKILKLLNRY